MRTIKFRIFNKKIKSYIGIHSSAIMIDELNNLNDNLIVEQFTGLHDKNGKEIYEGDIVSVNPLYFVDMFRIIPRIEDLFTGEYSWFYDFIDDLQVIVNHFDNLDLLSKVSEVADE